MADLGRFKLPAALLPAAFAPAAAPGSTPGIIDPVPILYPAGPTHLGFLYGQLVNAAAGLMPLTGGLISGSLAVGAADSHLFSATDGNLHLYLDHAPNIKSGSMALHLDKAKTWTLPHCLTWSVGGVPTWDLGQDFDTNNSGNGGSGNSDFVLVFDYTAAGGAGADTLRISPEDASSVGTGCKVYWGFSVGTPRANTEFLTLRPGPGMGGMRIIANDGGAGYDTLVLTTAQPTTNRVCLAFADHTGDTWGLYQDLSRTGALDLQLNDSRHGKNRLTLLSTSSVRAAWGFGGGVPQAVVSTVTSAASADYDTVQRAFTMSFNDNPAAHSLNIEQILSASLVKNYLWLTGGLGAGATAAVPVATSSTFALGFEGYDNELDVVTAAAGTNVALNRPIRIGNGQLGFFGATPISQQANTTDLLFALQALGLLATGGTGPPLNLGTGALTCGILVPSGVVTANAGVTTTALVQAAQYYSAGTIPTVAAGSSAGTSPPAPVIAAGSTDARGQVTFGTGSSPGLGQMVRVTFAVPYSSTPAVFLQANDDTLTGIEFTVANRTNSHWDFYAHSALAASQPNTTYSFCYYCIG
jgi:hypothetical protein